MKKIILGMVFVFALTTSVGANTSQKTIIYDDCFDAAVESLELAESRLGSMMDDESATAYLNTAYSMCWLFMNYEF